MLIAHGPAGYILSKIVSRKFFNDSKLYTAIGVIGSVASDFDMLYWHLIDNKAVNHHEYWTHIPYYWSFGIPVVAGLAIINKKAGTAAGFFLTNVYLHLALDSYLAGIKWQFPFKDQYYSLINPNTIKVKGALPPCDPFYTIKLGSFSYDLDGWIYNLSAHWTFQAEIAIVCLSVITFILFWIKDIFKN